MEGFRGKKGKGEKHYNYNLKKKINRKIKQMLLLDAVTSVGNVWHFSSWAVVLRGIRL